MELETGSKAPAFTLKSADGTNTSLKQFAGKKIVLYFYPKDNTPGCTKEACSLRDNYPAITEKGAIVIGISPDPESSHQKFIGKHDLPFYLLSDPDHTVAALYGAWGEKKMYGKTYDGILRKTFLIDESGIITKIFNKVKTAEHGFEVLEHL